MKPPASKHYWNYRAVRRVWRAGTAEEEVTFAIHEAHYKTGTARPASITTDAVSAAGDTPQELRQSLQQMLRALQRPALDWDTRRELRPPRRKGKP